MYIYHVSFGWQKLTVKCILYTIHVCIITEQTLYYYGLNGTKYRTRNTHGLWRVNGRNDLCVNVLGFNSNSMKLLLLLLLFFD